MSSAAALYTMAPIAPPQSLRARTELRHKSLDEQRSLFILHWEQIALHMQPRRGQFLSRKKQPTRGGVMNTKIVDNTATLAARILRSGMLSGLTSPARPWFRLTTRDPALREDPEVRQWLSIVEKRMYEILARSNFYKAMPQIYNNLGVYGTAAMSVEADDDTVVRFFPFDIGSFMLAVGPDLRVDTCYRDFQMKSSDLAREFGELNLPSFVLSDLKRDGETWHDVVHAVEPNDDYDPNGPDNSQNKPFRSLWYLPGDQENKERFLRKSGFDSFPIVAPAWERIAQDAYGTDCPGMDCFGDTKGLQLQTKRKLHAMDLMVNPPVQGPSALAGQDPSLNPGEVTYYNEMLTGGKGFTPIFQVNPPLNDIKEDNAMIQSRINQAFYVDLFQMVALSDSTAKTATEVATLQEEKLLMLGPVLESLIDDLLDPVTDLVFDMAMEHDERTGTEFIPPPPAALRGQSVGVEYISILAQAQRAVGVTAIERTAAYVQGLSETHPEVVDKFNADQSVDEISEMYGVPEGVIVDDDTVEQIRFERAARAEEEREAALAAQEAEIAKTQSETPLDQDTALTPDPAAAVMGF
jgi:hypothetical protein